jgi:DNA-binding MarR family transcriptional regulator
MDTKTFKKAELLGIRLIKAVAGLQDADHRLFKEHGLSAPQYNVLRILRGAGPDGLRCQEIGDRMVKRVPDITRLLDRLVDRKLVDRRRSDADRRVVISRISPAGLDLLKEIDAPLRNRVETHFGGFSPTDLDRMNALLAKLEGGLEQLRIQGKER